MLHVHFVIECPEAPHIGFSWPLFCPRFIGHIEEQQQSCIAKKVFAIALAELASKLAKSSIARSLGIEERNSTTRSVLLQRRQATYLCEAG